MSISIIKPCIGDFVIDTELNISGYLSRISDCGLAYLKTESNDEIQTFIRRLEVDRAFIQKKEKQYFRSNGDIIRVKGSFIIILMERGSFSIEIRVEAPTDCETVESKLAFTRFYIV